MPLSIIPIFTPAPALAAPPLTALHAALTFCKAIARSISGL
jgi:hypothetical protein